MPRLAVGKVAEQQEVAPGYFRLRISAPGITGLARPGQFIHVRCAADPRTDITTDPLLRRPFSLMNLDPAEGCFGILYKVVGRGTTILSRLKKGDLVDVVGPLGNGFPGGAPEGPVFLVGGGYGAAPLLALARMLAWRKKNELVVMLGARTGADLVLEKDFRNLPVTLEVATDDGSLGHRGPVTDLLEMNGRPWDAAGTIFGCGPRPMLARLAETASARRIPAFLLLEEWMACGVGACLGCVIRVRRDGRESAWARVCRDGPVFSADEVIWGRSGCGGDERGNRP